MAEQNTAAPSTNPDVLNCPVSRSSSQSATGVDQPGTDILTDILLVILPLTATAEDRERAKDALEGHVERFIVIAADVRKPSVEAVPRRCLSCGITVETPDEVAERVKRAKDLVREALRRKNRMGKPCCKCGTVLSEKNSRVVKRAGRPEELRCLGCHAGRQQRYS